MYLDIWWDESYIAWCMVIAKEIEKLRMRGWTLERIAEKMGCDFTTVWRWGKGYEISPANLRLFRIIFKE